MTTTSPIQMNTWGILRENAFQLLMYLLGAGLTAMLWPPLGIIYLAYCALSNVLYMAWVCPYCAHYSLGTCRAGFHILSRGRFQPRPGKTFRQAFLKNVVVLFPGWFLPPVVAVSVLVRSFSWPVLALLVAFCAVGFWLLPEASKKHCAGCETAGCPRKPKALRVKA